MSYTSRGTLALTLLLGLSFAETALAQETKAQERPAKPEISWLKNLDEAKERAREQKKLVLDFMLIGNVTSPDC